MSINQNNNVVTAPPARNYDQILEHVGPIPESSGDSLDWTGQDFAWSGDSISSGDTSWAAQLGTALGGVKQNGASAGYTAQEMIHGYAAIASTDSANPTVITTTAAHLWETGDTVTIIGADDGALNDDWTVTRIDSMHFSVPVAGSGGADHGIVVGTSGLRNYLATIRPYAPTFPTRAVFAVLGGVNDLYTIDGQQTYAFLQELWALARADNFQVFAATLPDSLFLPPDGYDPDTQRRYLTELNRLIRSDPSLYDGLFEFDVVLPDASDLTYFNADGLHPTTAGQTLMFEHAESVVRNSVWTPRISIAAIQGATQRKIVDIAVAEADRSFEVDVTGGLLVNDGGVDGGVGNLIPGRLLQVANGATATSSVGIHTRHWFFCDNSARFLWNETTDTSIGFFVKLAQDMWVDNYFRLIAGPGGDNETLSDKGVGLQFGYDNGLSNYYAQLITHDGSLHAETPVVIPNPTGITFGLIVKNGTADLWYRYTQQGITYPWTLMDSAATAPTSISTVANVLRVSSHAPDDGASGRHSDFYVQRLWMTLGVDTPDNHLD